MRRLILSLTAALAIAGCGGGAPATSGPNVGPLGPAVGPVVDHHTNSACGTELWAKKTLQDGAARVRTAVIPTTVDAVARWIPPAQTTERRTGGEAFVYRLHLVLESYKREKDSDIHLVGKDQNGRPLVLEFPNAGCLGGANPNAVVQINQARTDFLAACAPGSSLPADSKSYHRLSGTADITGVGFYDRDHGQTGRLPLPGGSYVFELHPVLSFVAQGCGPAGGTFAEHGAGD